MAFVAISILRDLILVVVRIDQKVLTRCARLSVSGSLSTSFRLLDYDVVPMGNVVDVVGSIDKKVAFRAQGKRDVAIR